MTMLPFHCRQAARELGVPDGERVVCFIIDAADINPDWTGFRLEFVGAEAPPPPDDLAYIYAEQDGVGMRVWRLRIRRDGAQAYIEARAWPEVFGFVHIDLRDVDPQDRGGNADVLTRGTAMLYRNHYSGSGPMSRYTTDDIEEAYIKAYEAKYRQHPEQSEVAAELGCDPKTIRRTLRKAGDDWDDFAARVRRRLRSKTIRLSQR